LFSRAEELNEVGQEKLSDWECYAINNAVVNGEECHELADASLGEEQKKQNLHAKIIIQQQGNKAYWHIGSANATTAAMGDTDHENPRNTEMMVSMKGLNSQVGGKLLREQWMPEKGPQLFVKHEFQAINNDGFNALKKTLRETVHQLISYKWILECKFEKGDAYKLILSVEKYSALEEGISVDVRQLSVPGSRTLDNRMIWDMVELSNISALIRVDVTIERMGEQLKKRLVIEADIAIEGGDFRHEEIMKSILDTPDKVLNYLLLQLNHDKNHWEPSGKKGGKKQRKHFSSESPIFEQLLEASSRHPNVLKRIDSSLQRLKKAKVNIPTEFSDLWKHFAKEVK